MNDQTGADPRPGIIDKANSDPEFRGRLKADPPAALAEMGVNLPDGTTVNVHEDSEDTFNLVLPRQATERSLSDQELSGISGGFFDQDDSWAS